NAVVLRPPKPDQYYVIPDIPSGYLTLLGISKRRLRRAQMEHLSRWPKVSYQVPKPEVLRGHSGLAARLLRVQSQHPVRGIAGQSIDRGSLPIGGDKSLQFAPELVHRVQFRSLLGQPDKPDGERCGQHLGARGGVRAGPVGE